jgi:hypothetical protein
MKIKERNREGSEQMEQNRRRGTKTGEMGTERNETKK